MMKRILVTGAAGQVGSELVPALRERYGKDNVIASDLRIEHREKLGADGPFEYVDVTDFRQLQDVIRRYDVGTVHHLAALLSAVAEEKPQVAWSINMGGMYRVLEVARQVGCSVFVPSSIGAFGTSTPRDMTPQDTIQRPNTMYGVTKVAGELLSDYYHDRFGVDVRGVRFPGLISYVAPAGGGTTDYAVEIFYEAIRHKRYHCFLEPETALPMMYMPDAIRSIIELMEADEDKLVHRNAFNLTAMSFTPEQLASEIRRHIKDFEIIYEVDPVRQDIANSWPRSIDDGAAREEWGWKPEYDLARMTADMIEKLGGRLLRET